MLEGIRGGIEGKIFDVEGGIGLIDIRIRAADTDDLAATYRIAGVTITKILGRIGNADPVECWKSQDADGIELDGLIPKSGIVASIHEAGKDDQREFGRVRSRY